MFFSVSVSPSFPVTMFIGHTLVTRMWSLNILFLIHFWQTAFFDCKDQLIWTVVEEKFPFNCTIAKDQVWKNWLVVAGKTSHTGLNWHEGNSRINKQPALKYMDICIRTCVTAVKSVSEKTVWLWWRFSFLPLVVRRLKLSGCPRIKWKSIKPLISSTKTYRQK